MGFLLRFSNFRDLPDGSPTSDESKKYLYHIKQGRLWKSARNLYTYTSEEKDQRSRVWKGGLMPPQKSSYFERDQ